MARKNDSSTDVVCIREWKTLSAHAFNLFRGGGGRWNRLQYHLRLSASRVVQGHDVASISMCLLAPGAQRSGVVSRTSIQSATNVFDVVVVKRFPGYPLAVLDGRQKILGQRWKCSPIRL